MVNGLPSFEQIGHIDWGDAQINQGLGEGGSRPSAVALKGNAGGQPRLTRQGKTFRVVGQVKDLVDLCGREIVDCDDIFFHGRPGVVHIPHP